MSHRNKFIENPQKAVFLTGFNKRHKGNWRQYREACYQKFKNLGVYIVKFDLPSYTDSAYLHCRTEQGATKLLMKKFIYVNDDKILIYKYKTDKRSLESSLRASQRNSGYNSPTTYRSRSRDLLQPKIVEEDNDTAYNSGIVVSTPCSIIDKVDRFRTAENLIESNEYKTGIKMLRQISNSQKDNEVNFNKAPGTKVIQSDDMIINIIDNMVDINIDQKYGIKIDILNNIIQYLDFPDFSVLFDRDAERIYEESVKLAVNLYKSNINMDEIKSVITSQIVEAYAYKLLSVYGQ